MPYATVQVLSDKEGLPILMCILYSTVCAATDMQHMPYGINMPGHFVLACKLSDDTAAAITNTVVIDAYDCGKLVQPQVIKFN
jgi:regulator of sirC expression with transglutaminase-like and TPR domain